MYNNEKSDSYLEKFDSSTPFWERKTFWNGFLGMLLIFMVIYLFLFFQPGAEIRLNNFAGLDNQKHISYMNHEYYSYISSGKSNDFWRKELFNENRAYKKGKYTIEILGEKNKDKVLQIRIWERDKVSRKIFIEFKSLDTWGEEVVSIKDQQRSAALDGEYKFTGQTLRDMNIDEDKLEKSEKDKYLDQAWKYGEILALANGNLDRSRGDMRLLLCVIFIFLVTWLNIKYPDALFKLRYSFSVKDPEPTELYIIGNYIGGVVCVIFGIYLALKSLNVTLGELISSYFG